MSDKIPPPSSSPPRREVSVWSALRKRRGVVLPDDERSDSPGLYVLVGLISIGLFAGFLALLVVPPALAAHLVIQGGRNARPLLRIGGFVVLALWMLVMMWMGTRVMRRQAPPNEEDAAEGATPSPSETPR